ncbi:hypothetical protein QQ054_03120 [Oscillatoria amoena NRMC-F 0135]|nr:hypothetical protein [Oscillatoria amoena NRMC-F 0135]
MCRDGLLLPPKVLINGDIYYGEPVAVYLSDSISQIPLKDLGYVIEGPDGFKQTSRQLRFSSFAPEDEKTYRVYTTWGNCRSEMITFTLKGQNRSAPCSPKDNWMELKGVNAYENIDLTTFKVEYFSPHSYVTCESSNGKQKVLIVLNQVPIVKGVYDLNGSPSMNSTEKEGSIQVINGTTGITDYLTFSGSGEMYVLENPITKKLELTVCEQPLRMFGDTIDYPFTLKLLLN